MTLLAEILGFSAGALVVASTVQRAYRVMRSPMLAAHEDTARNAMQCAGNALLMAYSILNGGLCLTAMCGVTILMVLYLLYAKRKTLTGYTYTP
jgi:hypothetical protein